MNTIASLQREKCEAEEVAAEEKKLLQSEKLEVWYLIFNKYK